jgi:PAS domain S-box-containing protein
MNTRDSSKLNRDTEARQARLDRIVRESFNEIYIVNDKTLEFEYANNSALRNLGLGVSELGTMKLTDLFSYPDEMALEAILNSLRRGETERLQLQLRFRRKSGTSYDADTSIQVLEKDESFVIIVTDITNRLNTERKLLHTIQEKETLIKEIHHRVKNNLQLISSIIYLKMASIDQQDIKTFLEDTRQKIRSIALIHERLLQTEKLDKVEIRDYLGKLIQDLKTSYFRPDLDLKIESAIDEELISLDTAIICGLIVNELLTNSIKHAFKNRKSGKISIQLILSETAPKHTLTLSDDGVGLPENIKPGVTNSFGMQLLDVFVKQLNGTLEIIREKGTIFQIRF